MPLKVFVLAGQSNMEGQAEVAEKWPNGTYKNGTLAYQVRDPRTSAELSEVWNNETGNWTVRSDVWVWFNEKGKDGMIPANIADGTYGNLTVGYGVLGSPEHIGPEFGFGYGMGDVLKEQVLIIKTAWGGKTLGGDFRPPSSCNATNGKSVGFYYKQMVQYVANILAPENITKVFPGYANFPGHEIVGFGWDQGWNDGCTENLVAEYETNMVNLIKDLRKEWNVPNMAVSIPVSGFGGWGQKNTRRLGIIQAQFNAANATRHPELNGHVIAEETRSFWRDPAYCPSKQAYHWGHNAESYWLIGKAMASGMLKMVMPSTSRLH